MKLVNLSIVAAAACVLATSAHALKTEDRVLKGNMQVEYTKVPGDVNSIGEMFTQGELYGRLRSNSFWWDWENEKAGSTADNNMVGLGGSMVYKTGFFHGLGATAGFYGSIPLDEENTIGTAAKNYGKAGKDTYRTRPDGSEAAMGVFAEAYLEYKTGKTDVKVGRQMIESTLMASNDTKMIPNTFEAAMIENKDLKDTKLRLGYITQQKLRDHQAFHSILASEKLNENDDAGVHKGLTPLAIKSKSEDVNPEMIFVSAENKSIKNLKLNGEYYGINGFFSTVIAEANYKIDLGNDWTLTPGIRYLNQSDDGAGAIGGAALNGNVTSASAKGYSNPTSVDASMWAARLVLEHGPLKLSGGYSAVADDGDIIAPWRGFPTGGYTRSMAQYNWTANTKSWMLKADYDFAKAGIVPGLKVAADYADMNFDDTKNKLGSVAMTDRNIFHVDVIQNFKSLPNAEFKFRFATVNADPKVGTTVDYESYDEYRFEVNYLF